MDILEAIEKRHSVRKYTQMPISEEIISEIRQEVEECNRESGLSIKLITNEPEAFGGFMAHYGVFEGVKNYIAMIGEKNDTLDEKIGYYGERLVLKAQQMGLNSCWVGLTFKKGQVKHLLGKGEKLVCVIALGYGAVAGTAHKSKPVEKLCSVEGEMPQWFKNGIKAASKAPTAMNQQRFMFTVNGNKVSAKSLGGPYSKVDLGIVKYNFEAAAGKENFTWA